MRMFEVGQRRASEENVTAASIARHERRIGHCAVSLLLGLMLWEGSLLGPAAQAPLPPWAIGQVQIVGNFITVSPSELFLPLNVAGLIETSFAGGQIAPPGYLIKGSLSGPGFSVPQMISAKPNEPLHVPPLAVAGEYTFSQITLYDGASPIATATPNSIPVHVSNFVISSVTARPMTEEEIRQSGIVINQNDYKAVRVAVALVLGSETVNLDIPVLFSASDPSRPPIVLNRLGVQGPPPLPNVPLGSGSGINNLDVEPFTLRAPPEFEDELPPGLRSRAVIT